MSLFSLPQLISTDPMHRLLQHTLAWLAVQLTSLLAVQVQHGTTHLLELSELFLTTFHRGRRQLCLGFLRRLSAAEVVRSLNKTNESR